MSDLERRRAIALSRCRFTPATFAKRFARTLAEQAHGADPKITERQAAQLAVQVYRFRRQIGRSSPLIPDSPPPGYMTPAMRQDEFRLAQVRSEYERRIATPEPTIQITRVAGALDDAPRLLLAGVTA